MLLEQNYLKNIILEVFEFGEKHKDDFSNLVKQYPFIQLVFSQWLAIKLYKKTYK